MEHVISLYFADEETDILEIKKKGKSRYFQSSFHDLSISKSVMLICFHTTSNALTLDSSTSPAQDAMAQKW
jgi:hypothetical protein